MGTFTTTHLQKALFVILSLFIGIQHSSAKCQYKQILNGEELSVGVMLNWSTSSEKENAMFIIERSDDGIQFVNIGAVKGAGQSSKHKDYSFLDNKSNKGQWYYRLRQIDYNGAFETSPIFIFNSYQPKLFFISNICPSSTPNHIDLHFNSKKTGDYEYTLMDWQGRTLAVIPLKGTEGANLLQVDLKTFDDLVYQLTLNSEGQEQTIVFRKKQDAGSLSMRK